MSIDSVISIAWDALKYVVVPIKRQFGYIMSSKNYAQDLQKEVGRLAYEAERVHNAVEEARDNLRNVYSQVAQWQANAEEALREAQGLLDDFERATKTCCYGRLPEPNCRYQFSRKAKDKIEGIQQLIRECSELKDISFIGPAPGNVTAPTSAGRESKDVFQSTTVTAFASSASTSIKLRDDGIIKSRELIMQEIMAALADNNNSVVGIYGMGGVGKSTLLVDAERRIRKEKLFDRVTKADVSENQDIKRIQGESARGLGLRDIKNEEYASGRAGLLRKRLENLVREKKKVLIILDNLWKGLDLKSVGIPYGHNNKVIGCKLLLTSRDRDVLRREMGCDKPFHLDGLQKEEAKELFEKMVGEKVHDDPFKYLVDEALHRCGGLPFLIIAMANIFKDAQFFEWKDVLRQIEMSTNKGISGTINEMLQLSYDRLRGEDSKELKSLLRLCVVYGVSKPSLENLVRYGVGLRLFREDSTMEEIRNRLNTLIRKLKAASLLLEDNEDVDDFKIHDLVRGFVVSIASRDDPFLVLKDNDKSVTELPKDKLRSCTAVCFPYVDMKGLPEELDCPEMQIFLLFMNNESLKVPNSYFNSMKKLAVLHLSQVCLNSSPLPFQFLVNLHTLCLDGCSLEDVAMIGKLKGLQILSFVNSEIQRLPKEIGQLVELRLLDLNHCTLLKIIEPSVIGNLMKLEELFMENSFDRWNAMDAVEQTSPTNARLIELNDMKNLRSLHVSILDPNVLPEDLNVKKLTKYKIKIGDVGPWQSDKGSSTLKLKLDPTSDIIQKGCIQTLLGKTDDLFLDGLNGIEQSICVLSQEGFPKLKHLQVENSPSIHYVLQSPSLTDFKMLESLILDNLTNLEEICNNHISSESFSALKVVRVESCNKMEVLFPLSLLRELPHLEEIQAASCPLMRGIVEVDDCGKVELRNLRVLELHGLPNIKNFFTPKTSPSSSASKDQVGTQVTFFNGQQVSIPSLESLKMAGLPNLKNIWSDESPLGLSNLQFLGISLCNSISKVINSKSLVKLHKLQTLWVEDCDSVQEIFDLDGLSANANIETLSELNTIHISGLQGLRRIWNKNPCGIVRLHNLKEVGVYHCNNLRFMFFPSMVQYLAQLRELVVWDCKKMEAIIMEEEGLSIKTSETLVFPMLTILNFVCSKSLTCFSHRKCTLEARGEDCIKSRSTILFNQEVAFPSLETVDINDVDNIEIIWDNQVAADSFHKLKSLEVRRCNKLLNIVPSCILGRLKSLESLKVKSCDLLEVVFKLQPLNPLDGHPVAHLPLKRLQLDGLPELKCVWDKELHSQVKFQCLRFVTVSGCKSLTSLFPTSVVVHLTQLEELKIDECGIVELIKKEDRGVPRFVFPKLTSLKLQHLTKLRCIYIGKYMSHWPALKILEMCSCHNVEIIVSHPENDMPFDKQPLFLVEKVSIPSLESLKMAGLPNLENIWSDESSLELSNLQFLEVSLCESLLKVINSKSLVKLQKLHTLRVEACILVQEIFDLDGLSNNSNIETLSGLNTIHLMKLVGLRHIWNKNPRGIVRLHNLKEVRVYGCNNLRFMFFPSMVQYLTQLRELVVSNCKKMEAILMEEEGLSIETLETLVFPMLTTLQLAQLESLTCFSRRKCASKARGEDRVKSRSTILFNQEVVFPSLETLYISGMDNIEIIWDNQVAADSFHKLKSLEVSRCNKLLNIVPSCILGRLRSLESLEVGSCDSLEVVFKLQPLNPLDGHPIAHLPLKMLELDGLPKLKCVWDMDLHSQVKFQCLHYVTVSKCKSLASLFPTSVAIHLTELDELKIDECGIVELIEKEDELVLGFVFPKLTSLKLAHLTELKYIYIGKHASHWPALKTLKVLNCDKVEIFASHSKNEMPLHKQPLFLIEKDAFPNLQKLKLDLSGRMEIWHGHFHDGEFFTKLRVLELHHFSKELAIFTCCFVQSLANLEKLIVRKSYREELNVSIEAIAGPSHELEVILPSSFQHLKTLEVLYCDGLSPYEILPFSTFFQHLETLDMSFCDGLSNIFTPTIARNLVKLTKFRISNCKMLTEIIYDEEGEEGLMVAFNQLKCIELDRLIRLRCFSSIKYTLVFPLLEDVIVSRCPGMKFFSRGPIEAPKLDRVQVSIEVWFWKENLNSTIQNMFEEMEMVARVKFMRLSEFPELIGKWHSELNPIGLSWQLKSLMVDKCPSFVNAIPSKLMLLLDNMRRLQVCDCESLEEIFDLEGLVALGSTRKLSSSMTLDLVNLPKLSNLRHAFNPSMARCLANLSQVEIKECDQMEGVIEEEEGQQSALEKITFPNLKKIKLECLPNLTSFLSGKNQMLECPHLIELTIARCPKMSSLTRQSLLEIDHCGPSLFSPQVQFPQLVSMVLSHMDNLIKIWTDSPQDTLTFEHLWKVNVENCKSLKKLFPHWVATSLTQLQKLRVESCGIEQIVASADDISHFTTAQFLFPQLTSLVFHDMPQLKGFCPNLHTLKWQSLEKFRVTHCDKLNMLSFVASMNKWAQRDNQHDLSDHEPHLSFEKGIPTLKRLLLVDKDIHTIQSGKFSDDFFHKPKALTLACFHDENVVFPPMFLLQRFMNLQSLEVLCSSFEDIFLDEELVDEGKHLVLHNLKELKLSKLHNLKRVWREGYLVAKILQSISIFKVWDCPNLTTLFPVMTSFQNLTQLVVKNSSGLVHLVTVSAITNLMHLTYMTIIGCERMKEIVADDENGERKVVSLGKLESLTLQHLPSLECFSSTTSCIFKFPSMDSIEVEECPKMKIFCKSTVSTPTLQWVTLFKYKWQGNWEGDLNTTIQKLTT